jgi:hypothetical protein
MRPFDTSAQAHEFQLDGYRRMDAGRKAEIVAGLSAAVRAVACVGIRQRHPDYSDDDVRQALVVLLHGHETARRLWPEKAPRDP